MNIAILGITGGVGTALAEQALAAGHHVIGIARRPEAVTLQHKALEIKRGAADDVPTLTAAIAGCEVVVSAVGTGGLRSASKPTTLYSTAAQSLTVAMTAAGVKRIVAVSAGSVEPTPNWPLIYRLIIHRILKNMADDMIRMETIIRAAGCCYLFVRPAGLSDKPHTGIYRTEPNVTPKGGIRIGRADLADYMLKRIEADDYQHEAVGLAE